MSNLPISSKYRSTPDKPVDDAEREDLAMRLNEAFTKGTIDQEDSSRLLDGIYAASTLGQLLPVAEALPVRSTYGQPAIVVQQGTLPPGEVEPSGGNPMGLAKWAAGGTVVLIVLIVIFLALLL